jgi:DNA-binding NarL/FixJ family response regulator
MARKVLIVDDELWMTSMVSEFLNLYGFEVATAENAETALQLAEASPPYAIILDVNLAGENGLQLLTYLHRNNPDTLIIIYTGMEHDDEVVKKALAAGAQAYLRKGGPLDELVRALESAAP